MKIAFRMWDWWLTALVAAAVVAWLAPAQLQITAYKVSLVTIAIVLGYWADRALFKRAADRIEERSLRDFYASARIVARAIVVLAVVLGLTQGI